ncbi:hydrolase of alkaline phosphatase superfamily [Vibrio ishigakensis]|uniref:Hydrolase of alkaline phosphatase superfamily n=1 Tax=Vibrio ishigakensis TaxID=1481914 RepID=A0A0B8P0J2_9VIBR|nr:hydrolase of alkaline phosphatase superfamily [Vibrio ishigakensis]
MWELLLSDDKSAINAKWQYLFVLVPIIFIVELALAEWVWRKQRKLSHKRIGRPIAGVFFVAFIFSHLVYIWLMQPSITLSLAREPTSRSRIL